LDIVFGHVQRELAGLDLGDVEHRVDQAQRCLPLERMRVSASIDFSDGVP
jgi:hypothetical protein